MMSCCCPAKFAECMHTNTTNIYFSLKLWLKQQTHKRLAAKQELRCQTRTVAEIMQCIDAVAQINVLQGLGKGDSSA